MFDFIAFFRDEGNDVLGNKIEIKLEEHFMDHLIIEFKNIDIFFFLNISVISSPASKLLRCKYTLTLNGTPAELFAKP